MKKIILLLFLLSFSLITQSQIIFVRNGLVWGVKDANGKTVQEIQFEKWEPLYQPVLAYSVMKNDKWGVIDLKGTLIIPAVYDKIYAQENFGKKYLKVIKGSTPSTYNTNETNGGKQGMIDLKGKIIVPPNQYDIVNYDGDGFFSVGTAVPNVTSSGYSSGGKWGIVDSAGKVIIVPNYKYCFYENGMIRYAMEGQKEATYSKPDGKLIDLSVYASSYLLGSSVFIAEKDKKFGLVDQNGKIILPFEYDQINKKMTNDMIAVNQGSRRQRAYNSTYDVRLDGVWGVCNAKGKIIIPIKYEQLYVLNSKLIAVKENKWGVIDVNGKLIVPMEYDLIGNPMHGFFMARKDNAIKWIIFNEEGKKLLPNAFDTYEYGIDSKKGVVVVKLDGQVKLMKQDGKLSEPMPDFSLGNSLYCDTIYGGALFRDQSLKKHVYFVTHDLKTITCDKFYPDTYGAIVKQNNKWGYISANGTFLIPTEYDSILPYSEKLTIAMRSGNWFILDEKGTIVKELGNKFTHAKFFSDGLVAFSTGGSKDAFGGWQGEQWGYVNSKGETVIAFKYNDVKIFKNGIAAVKFRPLVDQSGIINTYKWVFIDKQGKPINEEYFDEITY